MPIYEYQCPVCGHQFEEWQRITDKPIRKCPQCSARKVQKLVSMTSFQLKGGGWYADGYGSAKADSSGSTKNVSANDSSASNGSAGNGSAGNGASASTEKKSKSKPESKSKSDVSAPSATTT